ncbi:MBOAT, membrane-bound O-acyltransferase family-domain-containing protein, partial [Dimargaris cristalligena]
KPPLWHTREFYVYYVAFVVVLPYMFYAGYNLSSDQHPNYEVYKGQLTEGWLFGRQIDNSDTQYRGFRDHLPLLSLGMAAFATSPSNLFATASSRFRWPRVIPRIYISLSLSLVFLYVVFGNSLLIIVTLTLINYILARCLGGIPYVGPIIFWVYNVGMLLLNETYRGYRFAHLHPALAPLDHNRGIMTRWDVFFNITMLRMVSFAMDYHWKLQADRAPLTKTGGTSPSTWHDHPAPLTDRDRITQSCPLADYNIFHYWGYLFYAPLYFAGPIISFNNFIWQHRFPSTEVAARSTMLYGLRLAGSLFTMECMQHLFYAMAIAHTKAWSGLTPFQISLVAYLNLKFIWLKLMIMWRFFRFWAMCDGLEVPENMRRCMTNNYSVQSFWRDWHCSLNRWLVRYLYIPLGGRKYSVYNIWVVFTFVAIWHDISLHLLAWAWLICLIIVPELGLTFVFNRPPYTTHPYFRHFCAAGCVLNIFLMMIANLVGFAVGVDGVQTMLSQIVCLQGVAFISITMVCVFILVQVMFEIREEEYR